MAAVRPDEGMTIRIEAKAEGDEWAIPRRMAAGSGPVTNDAVPSLGNDTDRSHNEVTIKISSAETVRVVVQETIRVEVTTKMKSAPTVASGVITSALNPTREYGVLDCTPMLRHKFLEKLIHIVEMDMGVDRAVRDWEDALTEWRNNCSEQDQALELTDLPHMPATRIADVLMLDREGTGQKDCVKVLVYEWALLSEWLVRESVDSFSSTKGHIKPELRPTAKRFFQRLTHQLVWEGRKRGEISGVVVLEVV